MGEWEPLGGDDLEALRAKLIKDDAAVKDLAAFLHQLGAKRLADQIWDTHISAKISEHIRRSDYYELSIAIHEIKEDRLLDDLMKIEAAQVEAGVRYNNVVASLGYAGFLALMSLAKDSMYVADYRYSLFMISSSLLVFVLWNILMSVLVMRATVAASHNFSMIDMFDRREILKKFEWARMRREVAFSALNRFWAPTFMFSLTTGIIAVCVVLASLIQRLNDRGSVVDLLSFFVS